MRQIVSQKIASHIKNYLIKRPLDFGNLRTKKHIIDCINTKLKIKRGHITRADCTIDENRQI